MSDARNTKIIVHAGFYKTGTTSLQDFLHLNRKTLAPYIDIYGKNDFGQAGINARIYSQRPFFWRRIQFRHSFRHFLATIPDAETIVLTREAFGGAMPGHRNVFGQQIETIAPTAIPLAHEIIRELRRRFADKAEIVFLYTCRAPDPWLRSIYGHLLRSIHLTQTYEEFRDNFEQVPDLQTEANKIARALAPTPVIVANLQDFANEPEGPAGAVLDLVNLPDSIRRTLKPAKHSNAGQSKALEARFLALNRSTRSKNQLKQEKDRILNATKEATGND